MDPTALAIDHLTARVRQCEARISQVQDQVGYYGPPKEKPLFVVRPPRVALSRAQTTMLVYSLLFGSVGLYMLAKLRKGDDPLS